jgi:hypothetical protein
LRCSIEEMTLPLEKIVSEFKVTGHWMGWIGRYEVNVSLDLMQHSICVGHVIPALHWGTPLSSNHMFKLFLDISWQNTSRKWGKNEKCCS